MKHLYLLKKIAIGAVIAASVTANAEIDLSYYSSLQGLSGAELKDAIHVLVTTDVSMLSYGSGSNKTWAGFYETDRLENNQVLDRYSESIFYFGDKGASVSGMNIEHSFPKSWWGGSSNNAYKDLYNLMPCESKINSTKSNYPMGAVVSGDKGNGFTKVGKGSDGYGYWEPADQWKGDFARGYMYMATAYQDFTWVTTNPGNCLLILENNTYPTLNESAQKLFISWAKADPVTLDEVTRNDNVEAIQGNRNPYNDFPNLMEYVWGDSINVPFDLATTVKGGPFKGDASKVVVSEELYANTFLGDEGNCTIEIAVKPSRSFNVWSNKSDYGWVASAYYASTNYACDQCLVLPEVDLSKAVGGDLSFSHAVNKLNSGSVSDLLSVIVRDESGAETELEGISWPSGQSWTYIDNSKISLDAFAGHKIQVKFRYTSTEDNAPTWEIKNLTINGKFIEGTNLVKDVIAPDYTLYPVEYYSIEGRRVDPATYHGVVIRRQGTQATKIILR